MPTNARASAFATIGALTHFASRYAQPFSAFLSPSTDGTIVSFAGYAMAPNVPVGWSSMAWIYGGGAGKNNVSPCAHACVHALRTI